MRTLILTCGAVICAMGITALRTLPGAHGIGFLQGTMTLGGGMIIAGLFSFKMQWHGFIAAGALALLGAARGVLNLPGLMDFVKGDRTRGVAPLLETGVTVISIMLLLRVVGALQRERTRRIFAAEEAREAEDRKRADLSS